MFMPMETNRIPAGHNAVSLPGPTMNYRHFPIASALLAAALAFAPLAGAEDAGRYSGSDWGTLDLRQAEAAAADINLARLPNCDEALEDQK